MPAADDRNSRIALAKGWIRGCYRRRALTSRCEKQLGPWCETCPLNVWEEWIDPEGKPAMCPDFVGTLEGVSGMMRELNEHRCSRWVHFWDSVRQSYVCQELISVPIGEVWNGFAWRDPMDRCYTSPANRPGDCVGEAYMSGKEAVDA